MVADSQNADDRRYKRGFTLLESLIVLMLLSVLMGVSSFLFVVSLRAWDAGLIRGGIREDVSYAMEKVVRDLKEMANASLGHYNSIEHTIQFHERGGDTYVFYLYNADDSSFDSTYSESFYDLRKATKSQLDAGNYAAGLLILRDLVTPPATALNISGAQVTLDCVVQRSDEIVRVRTIVRPRNL